MKDKIKNPATLIERYRAIEKIGTEIEVPWHVRRTIGSSRLAIMGDQVSIGDSDCDFVSVTEAREALEWYVNQLGGNIQWREL